MGKVIGIDLGTTNCCVAVMDGGTPVVVPNREGARTTPSIVAFTEKGEKLVGQIAKRQSVTNPTNTVYAVKRLIGRKFNSPEVQQARKFTPYQIVEAKNGDVRIRVRDKDYSPQEISAMILARLKEMSEEFLQGEVSEAIITVPAYFDDSQRQATKDAGRIAGLKVLRIINEPTAASLAYRLNEDSEKKIVVYDLGGGTFDVSILQLGQGVFEVKSTSGDTFLGGEDFDQRILEWLLAEFEKKEGVSLREDRLALQRLKEAAEKAKCELSLEQRSEINLPFISADAKGPKHLNVALTREKLNELTVDLVERTRKPCVEALSLAGLKPSDIDEVLLVGGMTRVPRVIDVVREIFGKEPSRDKNPEEVVGVGAAIQAGILQGEVKDMVLLDVTPLSLGIETRGGMFTKLIERNTTIPTRKTKIFTTVVDNQAKVEVNVLQGEREVAAFNKSLGRFELIADRSDLRHRQQRHRARLGPRHGDQQGADDRRDPVGRAEREGDRRHHRGRQAVRRDRQEEGGAEPHPGAPGGPPGVEHEILRRVRKPAGRGQAGHGEEDPGWGAQGARLGQHLRVRRIAREARRGIADPDRGHPVPSVAGRSGRGERGGWVGPGLLLIELFVRGRRGRLASGLQPAAPRARRG